MKIAFTSSDGIAIDKHFGKADKLYIYDVSDGFINFIGIRRITAYSSKENNHEINPEALEHIVSALHDCSLIYTASIGETPKKYIQSRGIHVKILTETIYSVFLKYKY
ncbi:MAG TPA: NifB/NifX family molybdenum-iron cluster-binding protein [Bacteroidales bacterium]|nr:NifB/NifX family molybdenum-iron cluster-binding protein [Bacteroidales bacterium]